MIFETDTRRSKLYDVCADPQETRDLSAKEQARVAAYRSSLEGWIAEQNK